MTSVSRQRIWMRSREVFSETLCQAWRRSFPRARALVTGPGLPDDEIRMLTTSSGPDSLGTVLQREALRSEFGGIKAPVLALWAMPRSVADQYPYWASLDTLAQRRLKASFDAQQAVRRSHLQQYRAEVKGARIVTISGVRHYVFLTHARRVADQMRAFLATRPPRRKEH